MRISDFWRKIMILMSVLAVLAGVLVYAIYTEGPRVRLVRFSRNPQVVQYTYGSAIEVVFDRNIEEAEYEPYVDIKPKVNASVRANQKSLFIKLEQSLEQNQQYEVVIKPGIRDTLGVTMKSAHVHTFSVRPAQYAFLKRNYEQVDDRLVYLRKVDDELKLATIGSDKIEVLFKGSTIRTYAINRTHAVVVVKNELGDSLHAIDLKTKKATVLLSEDQWEIPSVSLSVDGVRALFTVYDTSGDGKTPPVLYSADVKTGEVKQVASSDGGVIYNIWALRQSTNNQVALVSDDDGDFSAISPFGDFPPIVIGRYDTMYGFDDSTASILLEKKDQLLQYSVETGKVKQVKKPVENAGIRSAAMRGGVVYMTTILYKNGYSYPKIFAIYPDGKSKQLWAGDTEVRDVAVSYGASLFAVEHQPADCERDAIGSWSACKEMVTAIYNYKGETINQVEGFMVKWIP